MTIRDRNVLLAVAVVVTLVAAWFLLIGPNRKEATELGAKVATAQGRLDAASLAAGAAEKAKADYAADYATVARLGKAVTVDDQVPSLLYTLQSLAEKYDIDFRDMASTAGSEGAQQPPSSTPSGQVAAVAAAEGKDNAGGKDGAGGKDDATAASPAPAPQVVGPAGFPTMPFTFTFEGTFFDMERFLRAVDRLTVVDGEQITVRGRLLTIDDVNLTAGEGGFPRVQAAIGATAFLLPPDEGLTAGATPAGPPTAATAGAAPAAPAAPAPAASSGGSPVAPAATSSIAGATR